MKTPVIIALALFLSGLPDSAAAASSVVINEIMYHPPKGWDTVQWVELYNYGAEAAKLGGWKLSGDVDLTFPPETVLSPGGFLVVAADPKRFEEAYQSKPQATFSGSIKKGSGTLILANPAGEPADRVKYKDKERWPAAADGEASSLERIYPGGPPAAGNWRASNFPADRQKPGGSPGVRNRAYSDKPVPEIRRATVSSEEIAPGGTLNFSADARADGGVRGVVAKIQLIGFGQPPKDVSVDLRAGEKGLFSGQFTAPASSGVVRIHFEATGSNGTIRTYPDPAEVHPSLSVLVRNEEPRGKIDLAYVYSGSGAKAAENRNQPSPEDQALWQLQQRIGMEANPFTLVGALALTNALEAGQLGKLRPVLKVALEQRAQMVKDLYEGDDFSVVAKAMPGRIIAWRKDLQTQLEPLLNAQQKIHLRDWANATAQANRRGFDPVTLLSAWINIEQMSLAAIVSTQLDDAGFEKLRQELLNALKIRATLVEPAKTAFESRESREKFQELIGKVQESVQANVEKALAEPAWSQVRGVPDPVQMYRQRAKKAVTAENAARVLGSFVHVEAGSGKATLYDYVDVEPRSAGWKVHLAAGDRYHGMTGLNLIFESQDRFVLAEPLAMDVYRRAGNGAPATEFVRLTMDGAPQGYHLLVEQPNRRFLARQSVNPDGVMYKIDWRGNTLEELHERKSPGSGHADLRELVDRLNSATGAEQWKIIRENLDVPEVLTYFAVNSVLGHWDGYMNNYFIFHDTAGSGKWMMYPWDQDKTFGFHDGLADDQVFTDLPVNFGATGDVPPGWSKPKPPTSFMEVFQRREWAWWRQPGPISGPVIANPEFRRHYASRIRSLLDHEFSVAVMNEAIDKLAALLREEVAIRAQARGEDSAEALRNLQKNVASLKRFVEGRHVYLMAQPEIKQAAPWKPETLRQ